MEGELNAFMNSTSLSEEKLAHIAISQEPKRSVTKHHVFIQSGTRDAIALTDFDPSSYEEPNESNECRKWKSVFVKHTEKTAHYGNINFNLFSLGYLYNNF